MPHDSDAQSRPGDKRRRSNAQREQDAAPNTRRRSTAQPPNKGNLDLVLVRLSGAKRPNKVPEPDMGFTVETDGDQGVVVSSVRPDSAAARAGIAVGQQVKLYKLYPYGKWEGEREIVSHKTYAKWDEHALGELNRHPVDSAVAVRVNAPRGLARAAAKRFKHVNRIKHRTSSCVGWERQPRFNRDVVRYDARALKRNQPSGPPARGSGPSVGPPADEVDGEETMTEDDDDNVEDGEGDEDNEAGEPNEADEPSDVRSEQLNAEPPTDSPPSPRSAGPPSSPLFAAGVTFSSRPGIVAEFYQVGEEPTVAHLSRGASSVLTSEKAELTPELVFFLCAKMAQLVPAARLRVLHPSFYELSVLKQDVSAWRDFLVADPPTVCLPVFDHKLKRWVLVVIYFPDSDPDSDKLAVVFYVDSGSRFGYVDVVGKKVDQFLQCAYRQVADPNGVIGRRVVLSSSLPPLGPDATATATAAVSGVRVVSHVATVVRLLQSEPEALAERLGRAMLDFVLTKKHLLAELWDAQDAALQEPAWWGRLEAVESADQPGWWPCRRLVLTPNTASPGEEGGDATVAVVWLGREDSGVQWLPPTSLKALGEMAVDEALESLEADREELERSFNRAVKLNSGVVGG